MYPHLFSTQKTNVSDLLTSDSPTRFLNRLVSVLVAVATLPLWEGLFRHTDPTPSSEKIELSCCSATSSFDRAVFQAQSSVRCLTIPVPEGRWRRSILIEEPTRQLKFYKEQKLSGFIKVGPVRPDSSPLILIRSVDMFPYLWVYTFLYFLHLLIIVDGQLSYFFFFLCLPSHNIILQLR